ncbi:MAG: IgGFc-binding protein [Deltaproteobacteria bacterium]|nr:IgGFc-binding protein [Deltaproteobacteria bacterium]MBK8719066.1 IgGFc-binding protein [Deltaproteobacteria bacterium]MBP7287981.1 IgGFc-binding protein [Nannocystaceae bacterium]
MRGSTRLGRRAARVHAVVACACCCACTPEPGFGPPPIDSLGAATGGSGSSTGASIDPAPDPCAVAVPGDGADTTAGASDGDGGFKFDVGGPDGNIGFGLSCDDVEHAPSNLGCRFWAVDLPNDERGTPMSPPAADQPFAVVIANVSALEDAHVEIFLGDDTEVLASATVAPTETTTLALGSHNIPAGSSSAGLAALRIESDVPIAAYQFNPAGNVLEVYSNDASLLLPEQALGTDYVATTADGVLLGMSATDPAPVNAGAFVTVVAIVDDTEIEIDASAALVGNLVSPLVLDRGQVATIVSDVGTGGGGNLSGTTVHASAPVAVFAGNVATAIPAEIDGCCADHLEHQLLPATAWGSRYAVAPPPHPEGSGDAPAVYRFAAGERGSTLSYCPARPDGAPDELAPGETFAFTTAVPFTVFADDRDDAFEITRFTLSNSALGDGGAGDPAMVIVTPLGQHEPRSLFVVPEGYAANFITVVVPGEGAVRLDGEPIEAASFAALGIVDGVQHRYAQLPLSAGAHTLEAEAPADVTVYGIDEAVGYAFAGGSGVRILSVPPAAG